MVLELKLKGEKKQRTGMSKNELTEIPFLNINLARIKNWKNICLWLFIISDLHDRIFLKMFAEKLENTNFNKEIIFESTTNQSIDNFGKKKKIWQCLSDK